MSSAHNVHDLEVVRVSPKTGFWIWCKALYKVYQKNGDQPRKVIVTGRYRNHKEAVDAARELLEETP